MIPDDHFRIGLRLKDPSQETPAIRQYLDSVAQIIEANPETQRRLWQVKMDLLTFGTCTTEVPSWP